MMKFHKIKCMQVWSVIVFLFVCARPQIGIADSMPKQCYTDCETQYGSELGKSPAGIAAYSNCSSDCVIFEPNHHKGIYTGIKWQCVEYARRWLLHEYGVVYGDVDIAADIWTLDSVTNPTTNKTYGFRSIVNGTTTIPQRGDLLIYGKDYLGTGHIAVVVDVSEQQSVVHVVEQNYLNSEWEENYSRSIPFVKKAEKIWILDAYLIGWKRVSL